MVTTCACHSANQVIKEKVQDHDNDSANKSPVAKKKCSQEALPETDATLPVPTHGMVQAWVGQKLLNVTF